MSEIKNIIKGHINEVFKREEELSKARLEICADCPLRTKTAIGYLCDSSKYLNINTGEVSNTARPGFKNGCGCRLAAKTTIKNAKCPLGKW